MPERKETDVGDKFSRIGSHERGPYISIIVESTLHTSTESMASGHGFASYHSFIQLKQENQPRDVLVAATCT